MKKFNTLLSHIVIIGLFALIAVAFFYPVLQGKGIFQSDIAQYTGMAKERNDYRAAGTESYWTNSAFGGMPTYQLGAQYPNDFVKQLDRTLRFLPRPADYLFLYFIGFYILLLVLKVNYRNAFLGAIAFGLSTYLIIILGAGHNAKAHAIAYFAPVLAGILLVFQRKYLWGGLLTAVALALELCANHFQMTYYLLLLILPLGIGFLYFIIKEKQWIHLGKTAAALVVALLVSVLCNASLLLSTNEYAQWSTRGKSTLTIAPDGTAKPHNNGLSKDYITEYSYGKAESLNLIVPRLYGGSNHEALGRDSQTYQYAMQTLVPQGISPDRIDAVFKDLPTYWGDQPIVAAPAYIGAVVFFLFVLAIFIVKGRLKWWLIGGSVMALLLSWGKNFGFLTDFMIDYFPLYNKFRAVSSVQVLLELCVPVLAIIGLHQFINTPEQERRKPLLYSIYISLGLMAFLLLIKNFLSFTGASDAAYAQYFDADIMQKIIDDRRSLYTSDVLRSAVFILLTAVALGLYQYKKIPQWGLQLGVLVLLFIDLGGVAKRYVNKDSFVDKYQLNNPFEATPADAQILQDKGYYRVYEPEVGVNGARTSYFHHSIGGYHAAKPLRLQELYDYQIAQGNREVLNMLNVKYILMRNQQRQVQPMLNDEALGNAWFIQKLTLKNTDDEVMQALTSFKPATEALATNADLKATIPTQYTVDSTATIALKSYAPNVLVYESNNPNEGLAVFSEMYYPYGWKATIDGKEAPIYRVDYTLRAMVVPAGQHQIRFAFEPEVVQKGSYLTLAGGILLLLWAIGGAIIAVRSKKKEK